ncbi:MAG: hypothetical protein Q7W45_03690 [Bacteroidota bacterium]|nr:hypothetical protein [Bacteroidota bacterium]MDP3143907.1 hypothetical protein [Bacteroidota bacterium]
MKKIFIFLFILISIFSCKKQDAVDNSPTGTPITNIVPNDSSSYQALFSCLTSYFKNAGIFYPGNKITSAYYSNQLITNEIYSAANLQDMGTVSLNNVIFKNKSIVTNFYYNDTSATQFTSPHNWEISGTPSISTFSWSNANALPTFTASSNIPDSVTLSSGFTIPIKGTTNCNLIRVFIQGGVGSSVYPSKLFSGTDTILSFSASEIQGLTTTNTGYISVQLFKDHYRTIGGKRINFRTGLQYSNSFLKIKP